MLTFQAVCLYSVQQFVLYISASAVVYTLIIQICDGDVYILRSVMVMCTHRDNTKPFNTFINTETI